MIWNYKKLNGDKNHVHVRFKASPSTSFDNNSLTPTKVQDENDIKAIKTLNDSDFKNKILKNNNNYYLSLEFEYKDNNQVLISNIKCFRNPTLISYEYEHYKSLF